jgi:L-2-hydroxyglutarate oxidase
VHITPFRGEYHELVPSARHLVRNLIYPVPDPSFPFLGVHFTRSVHGGIHAGPNAVLALAREGYTWRDVSRVDLAEMARDPGLWRLARRHWRTGLGEVWRSLSRAALVRALRKLVPDIGPADLEPAPSGVRAQALRADGSLVEDFAFAERGRVLHVLNAPSPAATASLAIGEHVAARLPL